MIIHIVQPKDTIISIAKEYNVSPQRIVIDNGLYNLPYLVVGQALIILIPIVIHTVRRGETINSIAKMYNMTTIELMQNNPNLIYNNTLKVGQQLSIRFENEMQEKIFSNGYAYTYIDKNILQRSLVYLTDCTIFGYGITQSGSLITINDQPLINMAYKYNVAPIMLLSSITQDGNFNGERASKMFNNKQLQNIVINNILVVMKEKGYLGLDVDFEYIAPEDEEAFIDFLKNITQQMHKNGYRVNVDLAPKISDSQKGLLYESHNYSQIGAIADTVLIMTYEWGYTYGPPMAVAPLPNVRQVVQYAVTRISPEKIMLGIPNYGYDWKLPYEKGISRAKSIGNEEAIRIAAINGATISFDEKSQAPYFEYFSKDKSKHIVWFEDVRSMQGKFNLITEFKLRGGGYWNLMRAFDQNWALLNQRFDIQKVVR